jgi:hypothetical protein
MIGAGSGSAFKRKIGAGSEKKTKTFWIHNNVSGDRKALHFSTLLKKFPPSRENIFPYLIGNVKKSL